MSPQYFISCPIRVLAQAKMKNAEFGIIRFFFVSIFDQPNCIYI